MLKNWSIENFKSLSNTNSIVFAPMTILADDHLADVSGLLQSIAMIAQTLSVHGFHQPLMTNGPFVQIGKFGDIVYGHPARTLRVRFEMDFQRDEDEQDVVDLYKSARYSVAVSFARAQPFVQIEDIIVETLALGFRFEVEVPQQGGRLGDEEEFQRLVSEGQLQITPLWPEEEPEVQAMLHEYPQMRVYHHRNALFLGTLNYTPTKKRTPMKEDSRSEQFFVGLSSFLPRDLVRQVHGRIIGLRSNRPVSSLRGALNLEKASEQISSYFSNQIYYLSSQRMSSVLDCVYFTPTSKLDEVGERGEFSIGIYHANEQELVEYYDPRNGAFVRVPLRNALNFWLCHLGISEQVRCTESELNHLAWQMYCTPEQKAAADGKNGREFIQIMPIILLGLLTPNTAFLLIEKPEEQVRPEVQARLAKFFMSLLESGKRCVIETGSAVLIQELTRHCSSEQCNVYRARQDSKGATRFVLQHAAVPVSRR